ncbi:hypothetical protein MMC10_008577 [Thelotrema lepadinum]|nr:hypothetical protein [Thelotrema lepadinum]
MQLIHLVLGVKALTAVALAIPHVTLKATTIFLADSHTGLRRSFVPEMSRANLRTAVSPTLATRTAAKASSTGPAPISAPAQQSIKTATASAAREAIQVHAKTQSAEETVI